MPEYLLKAYLLIVNEPQFLEMAVFAIEINFVKAAEFNLAEFCEKVIFPKFKPAQTFAVGVGKVFATNSNVTVEVPPGDVVFKTYIPGALRGVVTVICVGESIFILVAEVAPNSTEYTSEKPVPVITISVAVNEGAELTDKPVISGLAE